MERMNMLRSRTLALDGRFEAEHAAGSNEPAEHIFDTLGSVYLNPKDFGASGSDFTALGKIAGQTNLLELEETGDFQAGQWITAEGCFYHTYGMVNFEKAPYLSANQKPLENELEIKGLENAGNRQTFVFHFHGNKTVSWLAVDPKYQTWHVPEAAVTRFWQWQGDHIPLAESWFELLDSVKVRFHFFDWKPGAILVLHVQNRLLAKIEKIEGNTLILDRCANRSAEHIRVRHHDQEPLQKCLDQAVKEKKGMLIPPGHYNLDRGLWVRDASAVIAGSGPESTVIDVSQAHTAAFWVGGGREFVLKDLAVIGNTGYNELPCCRPFMTDSNYGFWPTANQQMETFGSAALNLSGTEFVLCENLSVSRMASEALYLHGSDRGGTPPFIQKEHEGIESIFHQYTKQCIFRRCRVFDCGFNAFNNNDFAENTIIEGCHVENVGNFCENASRFTRIIGNYVYNAHTLSLFPIQSPQEFSGISQAIVIGNIFEGGKQNRGLGMFGDEIIVSGNTLTGFSKESAVDITGSKVVLSGNVIDLTRDSNGLEHQRDGVRVNGNCVIICDNQIGQRKTDKANVVGISICEASRNVLIHDNIIRNCTVGIRSGLRMAHRVHPEDTTSCSWSGEYRRFTVKICRVGEDGTITGMIPEYLLAARNLAGKWIAEDSAGKEHLIPELKMISGTELSFTPLSGTFQNGDELRLFPNDLNWNIHDNMILDCDLELLFDFPPGKNIQIR